MQGREKWEMVHRYRAIFGKNHFQRECQPNFLALQNKL